MEQSEGLGIRYVHADVAAPHAIPDGEFGAAACSFGLSDIDDLDAAIHGDQRRASPARGCLVFSILHPCFPGGKDIAGSWPATASYNDEGRWTPPEARSALRRQVGANHRTLSTYLNTLRSHDLWIDRIGSGRQSPAGTRLTTPTASPCIS